MYGMKLTFYGGTGEATGSNYILEAAGADGKAVKIMVDCGLHQGGHYAERENFEPFAYDPSEIAAVFVTHSHLDHIGRLPSLVRAGFAGKIYSTGATKDFAELMLIDSEHLLMNEAEREGKMPLYNNDDIAHTRHLWHGLNYHEKISVGPFTVELFDAGHILGSAIYKIDVTEHNSATNEQKIKTIVFSGDLGNFPAPIIGTTEFIDTPVDYCVVESTYGDRVHENVDARKEQLEHAVEETVKAGGTLMIPTFAMERTQELLYHMHQLFEEKRLPRVPVFIDSPLAIKLTEVYKKHESYFNAATRAEDSRAIVRTGDDILNFPGLRLTLTTEQSKEINDVPPPKVVIAGAGMSNGGRILHHEQRYLSDPKSMILFVGYQAVGSMGRQILDSARDGLGSGEVRIFGETIPVRCHVINIPGYSAHADQPRLLEWLSHMRSTVKKVFVVQGEQQSSEVLAQKIKENFSVSAEVPTRNESVEL
jgi:metallo-beta-lactamase family protein